MKRARAVGSRRSERVAALLDDLFRRYHRPELIHPDPLEFLSRYPIRWTAKWSPCWPPAWPTAT